MDCDALVSNPEGRWRGWQMANGKLARKVNEQMAENRGAGAPVP